MKITNETKIGAVAVVSITVLILGFNFLKGKTFFSQTNQLYAKFKNVQGLSTSNTVQINGLQVGKVSSMTADKNMKEILVCINMNKDVNIPFNSIATIQSSLLGTTTLNINLGNSSKFLEKNDTLLTETSSGMVAEVMTKLDPVINQVNKGVHSLDSVLGNVNSILDPNAKGNISDILHNLNKTTVGLMSSSAALQGLLNTQSGVLAGTLKNLNSFTGNLSGNNEKINGMLGSLDKTTSNLSKLDLDKTLNVLNGTIADLKNVIGKLSNTNGTVGLLLNDNKLYNNLTATTNKLNLLIDDLKTNPKRYLNLSIFGKKNKTTGLSVPLPDSINAPYFTHP